METTSRAALRFDLRVPVVVEYAGCALAGTVWNVSKSGVLIEGVRSHPSLGIALDMRFSFFPGSMETPVGGRVVRHTQGGFAAEFLSLGDRERHLLDQALPAGA